MSDILTELRNASIVYGNRDKCASSLFTDAANEIERLRSLAGAVTPGPSSRQIIRERIARLADGEGI